MMEYIEISAKNLNDAITKACIELSVSSDNLDYKVISEGSSGFLGIGSKPAIIKARKMVVSETSDINIEKVFEPVKTKKDFAKKEEKKQVEVKPAKAVKPVKEAKPAKEVKPAKEEKAAKEVKSVKEEVAVKENTVKENAAKENAAKREVTPKTEEEVQAIKAAAKEFLAGVFEAMELEVTISMNYNQEEGSLDVDFEGPEMGLLIGKRGQTLDSLQYLTSLVVNKDQSEYIRVKLDTEDYRKRRKDTLENLAKNIAYKVKKTRRPVSLEPMNPYERRIIHSSLQNNKFVKTISEGEEPYRHVVVMLKK